MAQITKKQYDYCCKLANKFAFGDTRTEAYDLYLTAAVEALISASSTYQQGSAAAFDTYQYRCVMNALVNEKKRQGVHALPEDTNACERMNDFDGEKSSESFGYDSEYLSCCQVYREANADETIHSIILRSVNGNERNATIVELSFGIGNGGEDMELKEIAKVFQLTHEAVRVIRKKSIEAMQKSNAAEILLSLVG